MNTLTLIGNKQDNSVEKELWQSFKKGDKSSFELLYKKYFRTLGSYGLKLNSDKDLVEDAIHDVFVELWRRKEFLGDVENVKSYLFRAVRNQLTRTLQKDIFEGSEDINYFLDYLSTLSAEQDSISFETDEYRKKAIKKAIENLTNRQSEVVHLRFYQAMSLDEIADLTQLSKQAVKNLLSKSYAILRVSLKNLISIFLLIFTM